MAPGLGLDSHFRFAETIRWVRTLLLFLLLWQPLAQAQNLDSALRIAELNERAADILEELHWNDVELGRANLNTVSAAQLRLLGLRPCIVQGILAYRLRNRGFRSLFELKNIHCAYPDELVALGQIFFVGSRTTTFRRVEHSLSIAAGRSVEIPKGVRDSLWEGGGYFRRLRYKLKSPSVDASLTLEADPGEKWYSATGHRVGGLAYHGKSWQISLGHLRLQTQIGSSFANNFGVRNKLPSPIRGEFWQLRPYIGFLESMTPLGVGIQWQLLRRVKVLGYAAQMKIPVSSDSKSPRRSGLFRTELERKYEMVSEFRKVLGMVWSPGEVRFAVLWSQVQRDEGILRGGDYCSPCTYDARVDLFEFSGQFTRGNSSASVSGSISVNGTAFDLQAYHAWNGDQRVRIRIGVQPNRWEWPTAIAIGGYEPTSFVSASLLHHWAGIAIAIGGTAETHAGSGAWKRKSWIDLSRKFGWTRTLRFSLTRQHNEGGMAVGLRDAFATWRGALKWDWLLLDSPLVISMKAVCRVCIDTDGRAKHLAASLRMGFGSFQLDFGQLLQQSAGASCPTYGFEPSVDLMSGFNSYYHNMSKQFFRLQLNLVSQVRLMIKLSRMEKPQLWEQGSGTAALLSSSRTDISVSLRLRSGNQ